MCSSKESLYLYSLSSIGRTVLFKLVHCDLWGPSLISTLQGIRWFVLFLDDYTLMTWLCTMKHKSDITTIAKNFH